MASERIPWTVSMWGEDTEHEQIDRLCKAAGKSRRDAIRFLLRHGKQAMSEAWAKEIAKELSK